VGRARPGRGARLSTSTIVALVAGALLVFWALGAYNRLIELRNAAADAWGQADEVLRQRAQALEELVDALRVPLAAEGVALDTLHSAREQVVRASTAMAARPLLAANATAWVEAETRLNAAAARVFALLETAGEAAGQEPVAAAVARWRDAAQRLPYARQRFNDAAARYDAAAQVFPTSLLVRLYGFAPAGRV
jgi:LemA protein